MATPSSTYLDPDGEAADDEEEEDEDGDLEAAVDSLRKRLSQPHAMDMMMMMTEEQE